MTSERDVVTDRLDQIIHSFDRERGVDKGFWGKMFDLGLAWPSRPEGEGGLGVDVSQERSIHAALRSAGVPVAPVHGGIGLALAAPTLHAFATADQKQRYLRALFTGEELWCQLFSEPGAGSDIASLATRAVRDGDKWVINGQKVWSSFAHVARRGLLCARTSPELPKHKGITYFVLDMTAEGVNARPLRQITGDADFNEVFLKNVVIPDTDRVGAINQGWAVTLGTLANERAHMAPGEMRSIGSGSIGRVLEIWQGAGPQREVHRDRVLKLAVEAEVLRIAAIDAAAAHDAGTPSASWSLLKLASSELEKRIADVAITLMGPRGLTYGDYSEPPAPHAELTEDAPRAYLFARAMTIAGGTSEIQRTIIADRVLGLPKEPNLDRDVPWQDIPRN